MFKKRRYCPIYDSKDITARNMIDLAVEEIKNNNKNKINLIWLEIEVEIEQNKIINAKSSGLFFRGFEKMLKGR